MKLLAKVKLNGEECAGNLIRAFFKEFNPESRIAIQGNVAELEIVFEKDIVEIPEAISSCKIDEFYYGERKEVSGKKQEEEPLKQTNRQEEVPKKSSYKPEKKVDGRINRTETVNKEHHPEFDEFAKKSSSYDEFVNYVVTWLGITKKAQFFKDVINLASEVENIIWKNIVALSSEKSIPCPEWDKVWCSRKINDKFQDGEHSITIMPLIRTMVEYKSFDFSKNNTENGSSEKPCSDEEEQSGKKTDEALPKKRIKMTCMPEILQFEETLGAIDKTLSIEERICYVLGAMGWKKDGSEKYESIFKIANIAVRMDEINVDKILSKINASMEARMNFARFVNDFVGRYDSNKKVKLTDFLIDLKETILSEGEFESVND